MEVVEKNMELEIKDIELNSQKKKYECLLLKVRHLNQEVEFKSIHISELENEINNLNQKWNPQSHQETKAHVSELENEINNLSQKLKSADRKALKDHIRIELLQNTIEKQEIYFQNQKHSILKLKSENKLLSQKLASVQSDIMEEDLPQRIAKNRKTQLEAQRVSASKTLSGDLSNSANDDANIAQRNSRISENLNNQWMESEENYGTTNIVPGFGMKTEKVLFIDLTEQNIEEIQTGLCDNSVNHLEDFLSSEYLTDRISEMTNEIEFKQEREVAQMNTILSTNVEKNPSQKLTRKNLEVILPNSSNTKIGNISRNKKENKFRLNKEALVFKSTLDDKNKSITKVHKNKCKICSKGFASNCALTIHVDGVHKKIKRHKCPICLKGFTQSGIVKTHINIVHKQIRRFKCRICLEEFTTNFFLKKHVSTFHNKVNA
jgi:hypothetical protein